jgi:uncharacterized protein (DUF169 family)
MPGTGVDTICKQSGGPTMTIEAEIRGYGNELEALLGLQSAPIAVRMLEKEAEIPQGALRPKRDHGHHYAQCQAFALSRRNGAVVAMLKEDNWCPAPVMAYGYEPRPEELSARGRNPYDCFELGRYIGILTAPLSTARFAPDVVLIYCDTNQLRSMLLSLDETERPSVKSNFFPFSCAYAVTSPILKNEYWINLPDPGEYVRALTQAGEMIFSIPRPKLAHFMENLKKFYGESGYAREQMMMRPNFPQLDLYKNVFEGWGMDHER